MRLPSLIALFAIASAGFAELPDRPNIIFVMLDDLGQEWISGYGAGKIETPNIDNLMETGLRFNGAYSMPKCTPTRTTVLTGQYPFNHGWIEHFDVPRWAPMKESPLNCYFDWRYNLTWPRVLKSRGYKTAATGKWQLNDYRYQPMCMEKFGFDEWAMWTGAEGKSGDHSEISSKRYWDPYMNTRGPGDTISSSKTYKDEYGPEVSFEFVADFLTRHKDEPMAIYYAEVSPHGKVPSRTPISSTGGLKNTVLYIDHLMGKLTDTLTKLGIRERTIIIFTTDNGTVSITGTIYGKSLKGGKGKYTENGMWAPFIVNCPGVVPKGRTDVLTDFTDMFPTFVELAGAKMPDTSVWKVDGHSIADVITGKSTKGTRSWILAMGKSEAVRNDTKTGIRAHRAFYERVMRNKDFKVNINSNREITRLFRVDSVPEGSDGPDLRSSKDPEVVAAYEMFKAALDSFPQVDQRPKYSYSPSPTMPKDTVNYNPVADVKTGRIGEFKNSYRQDIHARYRNGGFHFAIRKGSFGQASIVIHDVSGKVVKRVFSGTLSGSESLAWHPKGVASGTYLVRYSLNGQRWSERLMTARR